MQKTAPTQPEPQPTIPQHIVDRMENEWRQVRPGRETPPPAERPQQR
jgi:hypothetical protein